jgi:very-short-patch-repair endonuclease
MDAPRITLKRARELRADMSLPEVLLWQEIGPRQFQPKVRRQHPIRPFILDFYCAELRLAVEVDGASHDAGDRPERDERRTRWLERQGVRVLRLPADLVLSDMDSALRTVRRACGLPPD